MLDVDAGLAAQVPREQWSAARQAAAAASLRLSMGSWKPSRDAERARGGYGLLLVDGMLIRQVGVEGRFGAELLGPGDLLRPWQHDGEGAAGSLPLVLAWRVVLPARLAVLDLPWAARVATWPRIGAELTGRALARSLRVASTMAIAQQPKLDDRLWMLFWELADRYGHVHPDGVHLELPLTHEILSQLAGARRPSVSSALGRLAVAGRLRRNGQTWLLTGDSPALAADPRGLSAGMTALTRA